MEGELSSASCSRGMPRTCPSKAFGTDTGFTLFCGVSRVHNLTMIRNLGRLLPASLRVSSIASEPFQSTRAFKAVADVEIDFNNRETLKKYVGVRDHLSREPGTKGRFMEALLELKAAVTSLPATADYRRAVEATVAYRLKVCEQNADDAAVEEVLDAHLEELIKECKEEVRLVPLMAGKAHVQAGARHASNSLSRGVWLMSSPLFHRRRKQAMGSGSRVHGEHKHGHCFWYRIR
jgi:NADH dehydrogenase (ubiquinone) 1 alpha subcomplex subunit 5